MSALLTDKKKENAELFQHLRETDEQLDFAEAEVKRLNLKITVLLGDHLEETSYMYGTSGDVETNSDNSEDDNADDNEDDNEEQDPYRDDDEEDDDDDDDEEDPQDDKIVGAPPSIGTGGVDETNRNGNGEQHPAENDDENDDGENDDDENDDDDGSGAGAAAPSAPAPPAPHAPSRATESLLAAKKIVRDAIQNGKDGGDKSLIELEISLGAESKLNISSAANPEEDIARAKVSFRLMDSGGVVARFKIGHALQRSWDKWKQEPSMSHMNQAEFRKKIGTMGFIITKTKMSECLTFARVITKYKAYRFLYTCTVAWSKVNLCMRFSGLDKALEHSQSTNAAAFNHLRHDVDLE